MEDLKDIIFFFTCSGIQSIKHDGRVANEARGSRYGAVVRPLASHQHGQGLIPNDSASYTVHVCGLSLLLLLSWFLSQFFPLLKQQHFQIQTQFGVSLISANTFI